MSKLSKSPERGTFQTQSYEEILKTETDQEKIEAAKAMLQLYADWHADAEILEKADEWKENNLEYDLRTSDYMLNKVRNSDTYAQNLYAAMSNNEFQKLDVMPILKEESWSCSWRHAGGIIADMRQQGDYIDWYCSGIGSGLGNGDETGEKKYVSESVVTDEIEEDLKKLGWIVLDTEE